MDATRARSCEEVADRGGGTGMYYIDPDGLNGLLPFYVHCNTANGVSTVIHHNREQTVDFTPYNTEADGSLPITVTYMNATLDQVRALVEVSNNCSMYMKVGCYDMNLDDSYWMTYGGEEVWDWDTTLCNGKLMLNLSCWLFQLLNMYFTFVNTRGDNKNIISVSVSVYMLFPHYQR